MKQAVTSRRSFIGATSAWLLGLGTARPAAALEAPAGKPVLTVSGPLTAPNDGAVANFDLESLERLPRTSFMTKTPWYAQPRKFDGVLLRDLLAAVGGPPGASMRAAALNDYRVDIPSEDLMQHGVMLAYHLDDKPMSVREKGPLVIIYPFDDHPELRNAVHYSRAIWQLRSLGTQVTTGAPDSLAPAGAAAAGSDSLMRRFGLGAVVAVLVLVLVSVAYVQWRQYKLLDAASHFQNDALGWSFSQLETEQLRLRNELQRYVDDPQHDGLEKVQLRYDIFVSRVSLVDHERAMEMMHDQAAYTPAIAQVRSFIAVADRSLGAAPPHPLDEAAARALVPLLDALNAPLHDLSLGASHLLYQRAADRNEAVRQQSVLSIGLTAFQCLLLLALAVIVLRQLRALTDRRRSLEALADHLGEARSGAEAASRAKSIFLANMSHEIRTPFHGMLGMMSLLQEGGLSPQQAIYLHTARESAQHLLTILNDILDVSQLESGRLQVVPQTVELPQLIAQVDALMRVQAQAKGLVLVVEVAPEVPRWVHADPTRVKQILFNLLSNALKFTPHGSIALRVAVEAHGRIDFAVMDSGIGMDEATRNRLFQRFMQGDASPSRRASGAGLGLEISRDLARLMGGDITVRSAPGAGSTFTATLPLASVAAPPVARDAAPSTPTATARPLRVLVAEDHPVNRAYMEAVLDKLGHDAVFAIDGDGAVRAVEAQAEDAGFDVVLMDLHMPGMDGFTAAREIRALPGPRGRVPIVALTADAFQASRHLAMEAGMEGFLTKPAHLPQLREALARYAAVAPQAVAVAAPEPVIDDDSDLLDLVTLQDVRGALSAERYAAILGDFFAGRRLVASELRVAAQALLHEEFRQRAHAAKGAALSLGLRAVGDTAGELQRQSGASSAELAPQIDRLVAVFEASLAECVERGLLPAPADSRLTPPAAPARA